MSSEINTAINKIREAVANGVGGPELLALIEETARAADVPQITLEKFAKAEQERAAAVAAIDDAAAGWQDEVHRRAAASALQVGDLLPAPVAGAVERLTRYLPSDPLASVLLVLTAFSGSLRVGNTICVNPAAGYIQPLMLFGGIVATSGQKKSPVFRALVSEAIKDVIAAVRADHRQRVQDWNAAAKKAEEDGTDPPPKPGPEPRVRATGFTGEALAHQLAVNEETGTGLVITIDELDQLFAGENQYRGGRGGDEHQLLELWDGTGQEILRIGAEVQRRFDRCHISIIGCIQPDVLRGRAGSGDPRGKWARFIWAPIPRREAPLPLDYEDDGYVDALRTLQKTYLCGYRYEPKQYRLDREGIVVFRDYELRCQQEALKAPRAAIEALISKAAGKVARIAGILHVLNKVSGEATGDVVPAATVQKAIEMVDVLNQWVILQQDQVSHADAVDAGALLERIHRLSVSANRAVPAREVIPRLSKKQRVGVDVEVVKSAMRKLAELGRGQVILTDQGAYTYLAAEAA